MKSKLIILGCGSSVGVPRIDGYWGACKKNEKKNNRTRCSAIIIKGSNSVLIDTSPDLKYQLLSNKIKNISSVIFTHEHADQTNGLFELRPFFWKHKKRINVYGNSYTMNDLTRRHDYLFKKTRSYQAIMKANIVKKKIRNLSDDIKTQVAKRIEIKKTEMRKLQELYYNPKSIPKEIKTQVVVQIEEKKNEIRNIYNAPKDIFTPGRFGRWSVIQVVNLFLGMPVIPGR